MAIPTSRTRENAEIHIDELLCTGCGRCVEVCKDFSLLLRGGHAAVSDTPIFGCIGCGHCMAICPEDAIAIHGRLLSPDDLLQLPPRHQAANFAQLFTLMQRRRSIREFTDQPIAPELVEKILFASQTAPMGLPPSDVNVLVLDSREKNRAFAGDYATYLQNMRWFVSSWFLAIMRPLWGKNNDAMFRNFVRPLFDTYIGYMKRGVNVINYDAPLAMYFYGSPFADPADPLVAATYSMLAAEALGLGTCMLGGIHPLIQNGRKARRLREKYQIKFPSREGLLVIFGYPAVTYQKGIRRTFASITRL
ncbi:MAG: 4Fe-4S dicluster domain-containing protein [Clostridia bacterium]|nr:4Fe-4S dicluster domain-containing protein [Clostridia bacterium]